MMSDRASTNFAQRNVLALWHVRDDLTLVVVGHREDSERGTYNNYITYLSTAGRQIHDRWALVLNAF